MKHSALEFSVLDKIENEDELHSVHNMHVFGSSLLQRRTDPVGLAAGITSAPLCRSELQIQSHAILLSSGFVSITAAGSSAVKLFARYPFHIPATLTGDVTFRIVLDPHVKIASSFILMHGRIIMLFPYPSSGLELWLTSHRVIAVFYKWEIRLVSYWHVIVQFFFFFSQKLIDAEHVKKCLVFDGTRRFIAVFTRAHTYP